VVGSWPTMASRKYKELFSLKYRDVPNFDMGGGI